MEKTLASWFFLRQTITTFQLEPEQHPEFIFGTRERAERDSSHHPTQSEAIDAARNTAQREQVELLIHGRDGQIRERDSSGHDPFPPRG